MGCRTNSRSVTVFSGHHIASYIISPAHNHHPIFEWSAFLPTLHTAFLSIATIATIATGPQYSSANNMRYASPSPRGRRSLVTASTLILLMTITNITMLCHAAPLPTQPAHISDPLSSYLGFATSSKVSTPFSRRSLSHVHPPILSAPQEEEIQPHRRRVETTITTFKTLGGIVDEDAFDMGRTGLIPGKHALFFSSQQRTIALTLCLFLTM